MRSLSGMTLALLMASPLVLGACGQRGALYLPNNEHARDNRAVYMFYHAPAEAQDQSKDKAKSSSKTATDKSSTASTDTTTSATE